MATSAIIVEIRRTISDVFGVPIEEVSVESSPQTLKAWDSMAHLSLALALEESFAVQFSPEEIAEMTDVRRIADTLEKKASI
jgi:acyl carrier protein